MALLASELASVHAIRCVRCGATFILERPAPPAQRLCCAPDAATGAACQFVRLRSADRLDEATAQQLLYAIRAAKRRGQLGHQQHAPYVRARAAALVAETRALAQQCTVAADQQALLRASAALAEVVVANGGRVLPDEHAAPAVVAVPAPPTAAAAAHSEEQGWSLRWLLDALGRSDALVWLLEGAGATREVKKK